MASASKRRPDRTTPQIHWPPRSWAFGRSGRVSVKLWAERRLGLTCRARGHRSSAAPASQSVAQDAPDLPTLGRLSHSLLGALAWGLLVALAARLRLPLPAAAWLGVAVFSHFVLDIPMHLDDGLHPPDLHLAGGASPGVGLGLWNHPALAVMAELGTLWIGLAICARAYWPCPRRLWAMVIVLSALATLPLFISASGTTTTFAVQILVMALALAGWAAWAERPLVSRTKATPA